MQKITTTKGTMFNNIYLVGTVFKYENFLNGSCKMEE